MSRGDLLNAFSPAHEVVEPALFAGRQAQVREVADALLVRGSIPVIYGARGLGKSSLAVQAQLIAMGDHELLTDIGAADRVLRDEDTYITAYITCTDDIKEFGDLQLLIVHQLQELDLEGTTNGEVLVDRQTRRKLTLKVFEAESAKKYVARAKRLKEDELSVGERVRRELTLLTETTGQPVLLVIDEIDRVRDLIGLASFLKANSGQRVKFLLVGIGQTLSDLNLNHPSLERQLMPIAMPRMDRGELADIVDRAMEGLRGEGEDYVFDADARTRLVVSSGGFPWFVHVIGQSALLAAEEEGERVVTTDHVIKGTRSLIANRFSQHFRDAYQRAVRDSYQREIVLRVCAGWRNNEIPTSEVYPVCQRLGVSNPAVYRGHLTSEHYGEPLMAPGYQERGLLRFRNEMFKHYINLVGSSYSGVGDRVDEATSGW